MLERLLLAMVILSWLYWLAAWWLVRSFFLHQPDAEQDFAPPVSILKPVRGLDPEAYDSFRSFCLQDYPGYELLFGVADAADPAVPVIERLRREFPQHRIRLVVAPTIGANRKASILHQLALEARHELLVVSDSDILVTPDYLGHVVAPLADAHTGLVTCAYRAEGALTFTARLEALHMGVTFLPSVVVARKILSMRFAMGATIALRRSDLERAGGFAIVADHLADDFQLAARIAALGRRIHLSRYIVRSVLGATTWQEQRAREIRWARCQRICRPREYPGLLLTFSTPLAVALLLASGFSPLGWRALAISLLWRWAVAWLITDCTDDEARRWLLWLPVRDMLSALIWCIGATGRRVVWRGEEFVLQPGGQMEPVSGPSVPPVSAHHTW